ncbi:hypothetical protein HYDPIDRAFT_115400 [Hydnomerulius pinastri MD-312]|uniref:Sec20 C-terminal domain-containing protein n=1 Tax=Hydnomerulius pinastri MD-312 TaxID=994086 RepID=A0A0C9V888_9AGAM|nr:hypothetical protein HYDPIDRAFT_115400 [Hydnomerulius pinastri MD-312]
MPPIPTTFDADAQALLEAIERRQTDLSGFQIPRLRTCTGPLSTQQAWAAEVREDIEGLGKQIEELDVLVDDQRSERARRELRVRVDGLREVLNNLRKDSRAAVLASKRAIDAQSRSQREELLRSSVVHDKGSSNEKVTEDVLMKANDNVTETLQRTIGLMQKELERSVLSTQLLETSTSSLKSSSETHDTLSLFLGTSKQLVTALEQTDWLDRILIISALVFFGLVVLFVLQQRIVARGLRIAFWWTRFLPSAGPGSGASAGSLKVVKTGAEVMASVTASAAIVSSTTAAVLLEKEGGTPTTDVADASETILSIIPDLESRTSEPVDEATVTPVPEDVHVEL